MTKPLLIVSFYKFVALPDCAEIKPALLHAMQDNAIKGTIILATEGINGSFAGTKDNVDALITNLKAYAPFSDLTFSESYNDTNPFAKAKVKLREEIVTLGVEGIDPTKTTGTHVGPAQWNTLIADPEVLVIDTRNHYEVMLGSFKGAINPHTENFRDFPTYVQQHLQGQEKKKIAMFCTGGIRCEKSTAYLKALGFSDVYQLHGGILKYLESTPKEQSLWEGDCFVFDDRVALTNTLDSLEKGSIDTEWKNIHRQTKTSD